MSPQSPLDDQIPVTSLPKPKSKVPPSDWYKLGKNRKWKEINRALEARKEQLRTSLPDGTPIKNTDVDKLPYYWALANAAIDEIKFIQATIAYETRQDEEGQG